MEAAPNMLAASTMPPQPGMMPSLQGPQNALSQVAQAQPQMLTDPRTGAQVPAPTYATPQYKPGKTPKQGDVPDIAGEVAPYRNGGKLPPWELPRTTESQSNGVKTYEFPYVEGMDTEGTPAFVRTQKQLSDLLKATRPGDKVLFHDSKGAQMWLENTVDPDGGKLDGGSVDPERASYWSSWFPPEAGV